ncbi:sodium:calcium antiporter [Vreelandella aquamarina]|jgi:cation:H+ antiporter|uniref:Sodium:calcium antiporter n=2 Tax=Gammaproteobacteria TaxID=1236 RepID=A0A6F8XED6_9GAMM|nr:MULTISPECIES: calcium/sodium antiporter [Halomonas]PHR00118.1 MAG: sodium transporter [Halomonas sp.]BCB72468.1 sodium:calcium antiporter [Halomonas meridiana]|tara:strand:- start:73 stop:1029 length:957 start_codon:yes stop_codon:yes gene_type:complete
MHELSTYELSLVAMGAIAFGIWLLIKGGDWTVDNAVTVAGNAGVSKLFIAATVVAFGTSAPELVTSVNANLSGFPGISVGNVIGSNIANVIMVVAVSALIAPIMFNRKEVRLDTIIMVIATICMVAAIIAGVLPTWGALAMVLTLVGYVFYQYKASKLDVDEVEEHEAGGKHPVLMLIAGIVTLLIGSEVLVQGAVAGGQALGVPEAVIGMTLIAFGTSLPELTACVAAARKGQHDVIVGGIIGSNIFNIFSVMAFSALAKPLLIDPRFAAFDMYVVMAVTAVFAALLLVVGRIGRVTGGLMAISYLVFIAVQYTVSF